MMYGNLDSKKEEQMNAASKDKYFVRHSRVQALDSGAVIEDPGSITYQYYPVHFWDANVLAYQERGQKDMLTSVTGQTITILHDPTMAEEEKPKRTRKNTENETEL